MIDNDTARIDAWGARQWVGMVAGPEPQEEEGLRKIVDWMQGHADELPESALLDIYRGFAASPTATAIYGDALDDELRRYAWVEHHALYAPTLIDEAPFVVAGGGAFYRPHSGIETPSWLLEAYKLPPAPASSYTTVLGYGVVLTGMEGISMFAEQTGIARDGTHVPQVRVPNGNGIVSVGGTPDTVMDPSEEAAAFAAGLNLSDDTSAAFVLALARWCDWGDRRNPKSYAVISVADYCQARGWAKHHNGGYKPEHKERARQHMLSLNKIWVQHTVPEHLQRTKHVTYVEGQLMHVAVEKRDATGTIPTAFRVSPGTWANDYLEDNPGATSIVLKSVLTLGTRGSAHGRAGQIAQRIGLYMALQWRTKFIKNNGRQPHRVSSLLAAVGIDPATVTRRDERQRLRSYIESALDLLQEVSAIGTRDDNGAIMEGWQYANPEAGNPDASGSWAAWLDWTVLIPAPRDVQMFYENPRLARLEAIKGGIAIQRRRERAINAARAKHAIKEEGQ